MGYNGATEIDAVSGAIVHHTVGHAGFFQDLEELCGNGGRVARGLKDDRVAAHNRSKRHATHNGGGKVPRRDHSSDAEWNIAELVVLTRQLYNGLSLAEPQRLERIHVAEVDEFGDVAVGFREVLADFEDQPGFQLKLALLEDLPNAEQKLRALFQRGVAPRLEGLQRRLHRRFYFGGPCLVVQTHHFRRLRGIRRRRDIAGLNATAADDQVVFAAEF